MKTLIWRAFLLLVIALICSDIELSASLYVMQDNWMEIRFPRAQWVDAPWFQLRLEPGNSAVQGPR